LTQQSENVYFLGKLVSAEGTPVTTDRLGSVRAWNGSTRTQYPYGVEYTVTANDREKYATYTRDSVTGLDYAMNRYYTSQWGRFLSPDPPAAAPNWGSPQTWNRYSYVVGDPINGNDPFGLCTVNFSSALTGPPNACNTVAATAWGTPTSGWDPNNPLSYSGIDTFSTLSGTGLSQSTTITQIDLGEVGENDTGQWQNGSFWITFAEAECDGTLECIQNVVRLGWFR
jgi:RHS repeat-associated protein